jgi:hypothetical protein
MPDSSCPVEMITGLPVVTAPAEIDVTTAEQLRAVRLEAAARLIPGFGRLEETLLNRPAAGIRLSRWHVSAGFRSPARQPANPDGGVRAGG